MECDAEDTSRPESLSPKIEEVREVVGAEVTHQPPFIVTNDSVAVSVKVSEVPDDDDPAEEMELPSAIHDMDDEEESSIQEEDNQNLEDTIESVDTSGEATGSQSHIDTIGDSTMQELLSRSDLQSLIIELVQQEHQEQLASVQDQHKEQIKQLLEQQQQWLVQNLSPNTSASAAMLEGVPDLSQSPMGKALTEEHNVTPPELLELVIDKEDILTPQDTPESETSELVGGYKPSPGELLQSPEEDSPDDQSGDGSIGYFDEDAKEKLLQRSLERSAIEVKETRDAEIQADASESFNEDRILAGIPTSEEVVSSPPWQHEVEVPYSETEYHLSSVLKQRQREEQTNDELTSSTENDSSEHLASPRNHSRDELPSQDEDALLLQGRLQEQHERKAAQVPNTPSAIKVASPVETSFMSNVRLNLREKHARHLSDLRAFYEKEVADLRASVSSGSGQQFSNKELQDAYSTVSQRCVELEANLIMANRSLEEQKLRETQMEANMLEWQRKSDDFESQLLEARHRYDELQFYTQEKNTYLLKLEQTNQELVTQLQEAAQLDEVRMDSLKRDQGMMQKVVRDYENLKVENDALKAKLNSTENLLYDARKEAAELKRCVSKMELETQRLGRENDLMRHKGMSPSINLSQVQKGLDETATLLESTSPVKTSVGPTGQHRSPAARILTSNNQILSVQSPAYASMIGQSPARPSTTGGRMIDTNTGLLTSTTRLIDNYVGQPSPRPNTASASLISQLDSAHHLATNEQPDSRGLGSFMHFDPALESTRNEVHTPRKKSPRKPKLSVQSPSVSGQISKPQLMRQDPSVLLTDNSLPHTPRSTRPKTQTTPRSSRTKTVQRKMESDKKPSVDLTSDSDADSCVAAALERVRSGYIVSEGELQLACTHKKSGQVQFKAKNTKQNGQKFSLAGGQSTSEYTKMVEETEQKFNALTLEKRKVESALSRIPTGGTGAGKHHALQEQEQLEAKLEGIEKELGMTRNKLRQYHVM